jgi:hypothetical protein
MGTPPSLNDKPKGGVTGGTEPLPGPLVEFLRDVIRSPDEYKGIASNEKGSTDASGELKGLLSSSGHTKSTVMTSPQHNFPTAFREVQSSSSEFSQIFQSGGMLKQMNATSPKFRPGIALHNSTLSPMAAETSRSSSRSSRTDIQTKPGDKTTTTQPHPLQTPQPLATPTQQPTEPRTQTSPLGRNGRRVDGGAPGPPDDGPPGPSGDGPPGSHRDGTPAPPRRHRPAATPTPTGTPEPAASTGSSRVTERSGGGCCSCILSFFKSCIKACKC